jgi:hypothetical protein
MPYHGVDEKYILYVFSTCPDETQQHTRHWSNEPIQSCRVATTPNFFRPDTTPRAGYFCACP